MFREISADDEDQMPMSVESLCVECEETVRDKQFLIKLLKLFMMKTITYLLIIELSTRLTFGSKLSNKHFLGISANSMC